MKCTGFAERTLTAGLQHILYRTNQFDFLTSLGTFMASNTSATEGAPWPGCAASPACCDVLQRPSNPLCDCKQQCCDHSSSACNDTVLRVTICIVHVSSSQIKCNFHHLRYTYYHTAGCCLGLIIVTSSSQLCSDFHAHHSMDRLHSSTANPR